MTLASLLLLLVSPIFALTPTATGKELLEYCKIAMDIHDRQYGNPQTSPEYILGVKTGICEGYLMSANEITNNRSGRASICLPYQYNLLIGASVVVKYLENHPNQQSLPASLLTVRSLETYFPCLQK